MLRGCRPLPRCVRGSLWFPIPVHRFGASAKRQRLHDFARRGSLRHDLVALARRSGEYPVVRQHMPAWWRYLGHAPIAVRSLQQRQVSLAQPWRDNRMRGFEMYHYFRVIELSIVTGRGDLYLTWTGRCRVFQHLYAEPEIKLRCPRCACDWNGLYHRYTIEMPPLPIPTGSLANFSGSLSVGAVIAERATTTDLSPSTPSE